MGAGVVADGLESERSVGCGTWLSYPVAGGTFLD